MIALELVQVGDSLGVVLPEEVLARLQVKQGDMLLLTESANSFLLTKADPALVEQLERGRELMRKHRQVLRKLAE